MNAYTKGLIESIQSERAGFVRVSTTEIGKTYFILSDDRVRIGRRLPAVDHFQIMTPLSAWSETIASEAIFAEFSPLYTEFLPYTNRLVTGPICLCAAGQQECLCGCYLAVCVCQACQKRTAERAEADKNSGYP